MVDFHYQGIYLDGVFCSNSNVKPAKLTQLEGVKLGNPELG